MASNRVAYIQAAWHTDITDNCKEAFRQVVEQQGGGIEVDYFVVPGSLEIPLKAKRLAQTGRYGAICASGLVVDGGIYRHEFVAQAVISGIVQVGLETDVPVLSAVLTPQQFHEHETHIHFFQTHMQEKGRELANATLAVLRDGGE